MASGAEQTAAGSVLVCGALGTVGRAMVEHFDALPGWRVVGLSRGRPISRPGPSSAPSIFATVPPAKPASRTFAT